MQWRSTVCGVQCLTLKYLSLCFGLLLILTGKTFAASDWFEPCISGNRVVFDSGFAEGIQIKADSVGNFATISVPSGAGPCVTVQKSVSDFGLGSGRIQYQGGDASQRLASIQQDPVDPKNSVLSFLLQAPNVNQGEKGRIQMVVAGNKGLHVLNEKVRMYLGSGFATARSYPKPINWLTVSEWWNNDNWSDNPYPFRISVNLVKPGPDASSDFYFSVAAETFDYVSQTWNNKLWSETALKFKVPIGQWTSLEYIVQEGDESSGRFLLYATPENGIRATLFDIKGFTHHPLDPAPDGFSDINPLKLYTSAELIQYLVGRNALLNILWDDFRLTACQNWADCAALAQPNPPENTAVETVR